MNLSIRKRKNNKAKISSKITAQKEKDKEVVMIEIYNFKLKDDYLVF